MHSLIDTHIHLNTPELDGQGAKLATDARQSGIAKFVIPGVRVSDWNGLLSLTEQVGVYAAPGVHPTYAEQWSPEAEQQLRHLVQKPRVAALGEIGLDGISGPDLDLQEQTLRSQLSIAVEAGLPVLLHSRKTTGRLLSILSELEIGRKVGGIWHGFSGSLQVAQDLTRLGFAIGVGPILLRESARKLPLAVTELPAESLVLETDLPDMTSEPATLLKVAEKVAELRGWSMEETARVTTANACQVLRLD